MIALPNRPAQRQVDDPDVVRALQTDRPLNCGDHIGIVAFAIAVQNTEIDDVGVRRKSLERLGVVRSGRLVTIPSNDAGHVGAMPELIAGSIAALDKVLVVDHP